MTCYLDFDGTVVTFAYPEIGKPLEGVAEVINKLQNNGWVVVLNTYRANMNDDTLRNALAYLSFLPLRHPITTYTKRKVEPPSWDAYHAGILGSMYIDDIAKGIPLKDGAVDWKRLNEDLIKNGIYGKE
jgi:hypothetical protein